MRQNIEDLCLNESNIERLWENRTYRENTREPQVQSDEN